MPQNYLQDMRLFFQAFEHTQLLMLRSDFIRCVEEFELEIGQISDTLRAMKDHIEKKEMSDKRLQLLLSRQIDRLQKFLKEMLLHCARIGAADPPSGKEVIFIFERQHLFKNIYRKHLSDFTTLQG